MTKKFFMLLTLFLLASHDGDGADARDRSSRRARSPITNAFAMAIASGLCGLAQAKAVASSAEGMARNPGAAAAIRFALLLGLVLIESLALYTLVVILAGFSPVQ